MLGGNKMKKFREPVSGFTHLFGALASFVGLILLIWKQITVPRYSPLGLFSVIVFGLSLIFLYTASTVYHLVSSREKVMLFLRKLDHSMIFVLIAGTYTPVCLIALEGAWRWGLFSLIWTFAILGIVLKLTWFECPRWLYTFFYIAMGWLAIFAISPLSKVLPKNALFLLIGGGVVYTLGGIIYAFKWPKLNLKHWGFHEIFHLFVLGGSFLHYMLIMRYL